jgi:hypothetical protein
MDVDDELQWGFLGFAFVVMLLVVVALIFIRIAEIIYHLRRCKSIDQLLASIPDVPYKELLTITTLELPSAFSS